MTTLNKNARVAGALYLLASLIGVVRLIYIPKTLIVDGNAAATAANIASHESLFRFGIMTDLIAGALFLFVTLALYRLLKDVDHRLAVLMVILGGLMLVPIYFMTTVNDGAALLFARGADFLSAFDKPQRDAFVMLFLKLHHQTVLANEIFWGLWLIPFGLLVYKSRFLPRLLGVWLIAACFGYLALSVTGILFPQYEEKAFAFTQPAMIGELAMMLWLLIVGARQRRVAVATSL